MIATEFLDGQGLGNQLWVYAVCRSIAEQLNVPYHIINHNKFKGNGFLDIDVTEADTSVFSTFLEQTFYDAELEIISTDFDLRVLKLKQFTNIKGLFQSEEYFFNDISKIKNYIRLKNEFKERSYVSDDCCIVYIRGGEYKRHKSLILPESYWRNAMNNMNRLYGITNFIAISDDDRYVKAMFPKMRVLPGSMEDDYAALYQSKFAIIANSSWGYFPVKTGIEKNCVIAPKHWARFGNRYERWASPANLYTDWQWQDVNGELHCYEKCLPEKINTTTYYNDNYSMTSSPDVLKTKRFVKFIPQETRNKMKHLLSYVFPKSIG